MTIIYANTTHPRTIFRLELEAAIGHPQSTQQLASAIKAHAAYLRREREKTKERWKKFIKLNGKVKQ